MTANRDFARRLLDLIARDDPSRHAALAAALRALPGIYHVDGETFAIVERDGAIAVDIAPPASAAFEVTIAAGDLVRLVDGTMMLEGALAEDRLVVRGCADALLALARVVETVLRGALRLRSLQDLFDDYRQSGTVAPRSPTAAVKPRSCCASVQNTSAAARSPWTA